MSFPRYPSYKDSGVEWLGEVPAHWEVTQLKRLVNPERQITYGIVQAGPQIPDGVPYIRPADMTDEQGIAAPDEVMRTSLEIASAYSRSTIRSGDLVCSIGPSFGKVMVTPQWLDGANLTQGTARIAVQPPHVARYLFWTLRSPLSVAQWESSVGGATFRALNLGPLAETTIPVPTETEQTAIAAFLDRETEKIDELVTEQRRLMELLKEKRQAVISHAVTRGLNPAAPLKPSGIEWLGDVPAHWTVIKLGLVSTFKGGAGFPDEYQGQTENEIPFFKVGDIVNSDEAGVMRQANHAITRETAKALRAFIFPSDTIVFAKVGAALLLKRFRELGQPSCIDNNMMGMTAGKNASADFLLYVLPLLDFTLIVNPGAVPSINEGQISGQRIALPPLNEQAAIIEYLNAETAKFDTLTVEAQRAIDLLQERRTALISAAVTGQIDVRTVHAESGGGIATIRPPATLPALP